MIWFILAFSSALFSAIAAVTQKKVLFKENALDFSFKLSLFNLLFSIPFFLLIDFSQLSLETVAILYIKTLAGTFAFLNVMHSLKNLDISGALPVMAVTPGIVAIAAYFLLGDVISTSEILGILLLVAGTYTLEIKNKTSLLHPFSIFFKSKNHRYILYALLFFSVTAILDRLLLVNYKMPPVSLMAFQHLFFAINFLILVFFHQRAPVSLLKSTSRDTYMWLIVIALITIAYRWTNIEAIKLAPVALVLSIKRTSVFFAALIGGRLFKEDNLLVRLSGAVLIVIGAILIIHY